MHGVQPVQIPGGRVFLECSFKDPSVHHFDRFVWVTSHKGLLAIVSCKSLLTWDLHCQLNPS